MDNLLYILILTIRNFTKLPVLRYLNINFIMYYIYGVSVSSLLTDGVYRLYGMQDNDPKHTLKNSLIGTTSIGGELLLNHLIATL